MKRKILYFGIAVAGFSIFGLLFMQPLYKPKAGAEASQKASEDGLQNKQSAAQSAMSGAENKDHSVSSQAQNNIGSGVYIDYSDAKFAELAHQTRVLFFYASWWPQSQALDTDLKLHRLPDSLSIFKVDYDRNDILKRKYNITAQTTLVLVDGQGSEIKSFIVQGDPTYAAVKKSLNL